MPDPVTIASGIAAAKTAFDALRAAIGLVKDSKELLPQGPKTEVISAALATAVSSSQFAEAEIAKALGYELCKCEFPPTPMLTVGSIQATATTWVPVFECPKCGYNTAGPRRYTRTAPERQKT
jgi:hypothetical protein